MTILLLIDIRFKSILVPKGLNEEVNWYEESKKNIGSGLNLLKSYINEKGINYK